MDVRIVVVTKQETVNVFAEEFSRIFKTLCKTTGLTSILVFILVCKAFLKFGHNNIWVQKLNV